MVLKIKLKLVIMRKLLYSCSETSLLTGRAQIQLETKAFILNWTESKIKYIKLVLNTTKQVNKYEIC